MQGHNARVNTRFRSNNETPPADSVSNSRNSDVSSYRLPFRLRSSSRQHFFPCPAWRESSSTQSVVFGDTLLPKTTAFRRSTTGPMGEGVSRPSDKCSITLFDVADRSRAAAATTSTICATTTGGTLSPDASPKFRCPRYPWRSAAHPRWFHLRQCCSAGSRSCRCRPR